MTQQVSGHWAPSFAALAAAFGAAVASGAERGALAVRLRGRTVLDIRGGAADPDTGAPWQADTLCCCFSVTKGVFALLMQIAIDRGLLTPRTPLAEVWPEFAAEGKEAITVADLLTHRAGLPAVAQPVAPGLLYDEAGMAVALAASRCVVPPRAAPVYHNMTFGHLTGEVLRRVTGQAPRDLLRDWLATPLAADVAIGLDAGDRARCARLTQDDPRALFAALKEAPDTLFARSMRFFDPEETFNSDRWRGAVIGSGSGHATALGIARVHEQFTPASVTLSPERRAAIGTERARSDGPDPILGIPLRYGEGVEMSLPPALDFGPLSGTMGYWGAGGAFGLADPVTGLSAGYVTGHMESGMGFSARARRWVAAIHAAAREAGDDG
jgi:CubicO group peptidase (beta-lactamase class C family)